MRQKLLGSDVTEVARLQRKAGRYRLPVALVVAWLSVESLTATKAGAWIAAVSMCEVWTYFTTRPAVGRLMTTREMLVYILSGAVTMPAWATLGIMFWYEGGRSDAAVAVAVWTAQLLYTQRFVFQSYLAVVLGNSVMVATMVVVPLIHPIVSGTDQLLFEIALLFSIGFAISASLAAYARVRSLADQTAAAEQAAITDDLTGLPNRLQFGRSLQMAVGRAGGTYILYLDLDRFKLVNDTLGHQAGDTLLRHFAARLIEVSPPGAIVSRQGGDEFAILVDAGALPDGPEPLCHAILNAVRPPFRLPNGQAHVGVSIGVAMDAGVPGEGAPAAPADDLMRRADIALYTMKATGRGGFRVFSDELEHAVRSRAEIEQALRDTIASHAGLTLVYQPKVDPAGSLTGVEALVRWRMGDQAISPDVFIPIAEETGMILPLGDWIIAEAVRFAARWPDLSIAINLSPAQLRDPGFAGRMLESIRAGGIDPGQLELEVTETTLFESTSYELGALDELRSAGLHVALDDFGTGYSSLRHLHSISVDRVKIDQSFVAGLGRGVESAAIIAAVVQLGHSMGLQITAEGVETEDQRAFLVEAGCDELQGYFYSRPLPEAALARWARLDGAEIAA